VSHPHLSTQSVPGSGIQSKKASFKMNKACKYKAMKTKTILIESIMQKHNSRDYLLIDISKVQIIMIKRNLIENFNK